MIDGAADGVEEGWLDRLGWDDGCKLGEELGIELGSALIDGASDGIEVG